MRILTDCPTQLDSFFAAPPVWGGDFSLAEKATWQVFSDEAPVASANRPQVSTSGSIQDLVVVKEAAASQFDLLLAAHRRGRSWPGGLAALALTGQKFHGRYNRPWQAQEGNLHLSVSYALSREANFFGAGLTMLPSIAAWEAIREVLGTDVPVEIKWINDIIIADKKVAGVLTSTLIQHAKIEQVVFGIGVNLRKSPKIEPTPFVPETGCLDDWPKGNKVLLMDFLMILLKKLDDGFHELLKSGPGLLLAKYRSASGIVGHPVVIWEEENQGQVNRYKTETPLAKGVVNAIEPDLSLKIEGYTDPIHRGRLAFERVCRALNLDILD